MATLGVAMKGSRGRAGGFFGAKRGGLAASTSAAAAVRTPRETGTVKRRMTMTEKVLHRHNHQQQQSSSSSGGITPGENIWCSVDKLLTHDVCGPPAFGIFEREFGSDAKVWDPEKVIIIPDHFIFTDDPLANRNVDILRDIVDRQGIKYFYDIKDRSDFRANPKYKGVCHIAFAQEGHAKPGEVLFGTDSHTCNAGAFGEFATGIGNTDAAFILGTGKLLVKVPPTIRFIFEGQMPEHLLAKDIILHVIGEITVSGATYKSLEFTGSAIEGMSMEERMTICNMVVEAGAKNGIMTPDQVTFDYVNARQDKDQEGYEPVYADEGASYLETYVVNVEDLEPVVAAPHSPDNRKRCSEVKGTPIDRVYVGSCTGGKTEDFLAVAKILHKSGEQVKVPTYLVPATQQVWADVYALPVPDCDGKTAAEVFESAGCVPPGSPSCAACLGGPKDTFARINSAEVCVSTTNRNFPGRMGDKSASVYLASPYTAAASALAGSIADPRDYM
eukprot:CAMPEP_0198240880 /NCGR_PEP_ID=MMETSP1446-20131203/5869_1 /TAXON_ID=1461542 ORGANISM="Unidentified sp, Strain CCMP2111" /NCGR_SAMPLE_ID=MMETSP1446 /ASSEMBLY_ACC=CAM_ASM_001112 /LENGTH=501 /DNA_ID=CAMNT_0043923663 /DNA_START=2508 /DNA_END=4013 /DNA_ORIENTATION=-